MKPPHFSLCRLLRLAVFLLPLGALSSCSSHSWQKLLTGPSATVSYDDLGTEAMLIPVLGPRGEDPRILVHLGATRADSQPRKLSAHNGLLMLRRNEEKLPRTAENEPLRERMRHAYSRIYQYYRTRRDASLAAPPYVGRGAMNRMQMMPPVPSAL